MRTITALRSRKSCLGPVFPTIYDFGSIKISDASLTADPGVASSIPAWSSRGDWSWNNFYGNSPPFRWIIQEGLLSVTSESVCTKYLLTACSILPRKSVVRWTDRPAMTIAVDLGRKATTIYMWLVTQKGTSWVDYVILRKHVLMLTSRRAKITHLSVFQREV